MNVTARLESLAEPGGIYISESVHTTVGNKMPLDYEFVGEQTVKNITQPVRAYSVRLKPGANCTTNLCAYGTLSTVSAIRGHLLHCPVEQHQPANQVGDGVSR